MQRQAPFTGYIQRIHVYLSICLLLLLLYHPPYLYFFSFFFTLFFQKVTETFGTVTAVFKATWLGTQMLTEKDLPLHVAQSTLHIQCTFLLFFKSFFLSLSLPSFILFLENKKSPTYYPCTRWTCTLPVCSHRHSTRGFAATMLHSARRSEHWICGWGWVSPFYFQMSDDL